MLDQMGRLLSMMDAADCMLQAGMRVKHLAFSVQLAIHCPALWGDAHLLRSLLC